MLVLDRKIGESIIVGECIKVMLVETGRGRARIGIEAPGDVKILREELEPLPKSDGPETGDAHAR